MRSHKENGRIIVCANQCDQIGQTFKNLWQIFEGLFSAWQNFEPTLANLLYILGKFEALKEAK